MSEAVELFAGLALLVALVAGVLMLMGLDEIGEPLLVRTFFAILIIIILGALA